MQHKKTCPVSKQLPPTNSVRAALDDIFCTCNVDRDKIYAQMFECGFKTNFSERECCDCSNCWGVTKEELKNKFRQSIKLKGSILTLEEFLES